ncbi:DNA-directed RNA polymerase subunit omega [Lapidilactobacillus mulanensis]|uniref:DNA-directed RNA polymerase subunit omega n=1 Tax=Lapidilactobacillus mulanensis TaxID=2485999 RepID=A0ABW4DLM8_9LACO|nr:DNA-directed RNA polymerase subunit omega [Lapidilactobacillus mulanensis]
MISYPSIDKLLDKVDSRYSLAILAAKRAHQLETGSFEMLDDYKSSKTVGMALEEIANGKITIDPNSNLKEADAEAIDQEKSQEEADKNNDSKKTDKKSDDSQENK